jgi:hypothetical protein
MLEMRHRELPTHLYASDDDPLLADPVEKTPGAPTGSYMQILITLHMDYLVVALPRGLIPRMMTDTFGNKVRHSGNIQGNIQIPFRAHSLKVPRGSIPRMMADNFGNKVRHSGKIQ